jgi:VanZ family protein
MPCNQTAIYRLALILTLGAITFLATTGHGYPVVKDISDKANHMLAFYVLAMLVDFSFPKTRFGVSKILALLTYGLLIEIIQGFLPDRTPSLVDLLADGVGIAMYKLSVPILTRVPFFCLRWKG